MAKLNEWCKTARIAMINKDLSVKDLSAGTGLSRSYCASILNGRARSGPGIMKISDFLGIPVSDEPIRS